jgi:lipid-binding SYLF domain-containing protein
MKPTTKSILSIYKFTYIACLGATATLLHAAQSDNADATSPSLGQDTLNTAQTLNNDADKTATDAATGAKTMSADVKQKLEDRIKDAEDFYHSLQSKNETGIPDRVVEHAKGVLVITRWIDAAGAGVAQGYAIGMKKLSDGSFSQPVFYKLDGINSDVQAAGKKTQTFAFLMSDKALSSLNDSSLVWSGNINAVAGGHSVTQTTLDNAVDVMLYQKSAELDVGAAISAVKLTYDLDSNAQYYGKSNISAQVILSGKAPAAPVSASVIATSLNRQVSAATHSVVNGTVAPGVSSAQSSAAAPGQIVPNTVQGAQQTVHNLPVVGH